MNKEKLENSICQSITADLLTINRQIYFYSEIDNQKFVDKNENLNLIQLKNKTKNDFDLLVKEICLNNDWNIQYELSDMMNNELNDEDLNQILFQNINQYSDCEWLKFVFFCFCSKDFYFYIGE